LQHSGKGPCHTHHKPKKTTLKYQVMNENLRDVLMPLAIMGSFGLALLFFTRAITDYILKKKMIEKGFVNDDTQAIFKRHTEENKFSTLKWGLIILTGGIALIILEYVPYERESPLPYGIFAVAVSLGFLAYYFLVRKDLNK
jgi:hypothetical protein